MAAIPSTQRSAKLRAAAASSVIDSSSATAVTGSITFSSSSDPVWANPIVASLPTTRATTIVRLSTMTGFTLPGMIDEPGCVSGRAISARPARGPMPISRTSLPIFQSDRAIVRIAPWAAIAASSVAWAWKWLADLADVEPGQRGERARSPGPRSPGGR